MIFTPKYIKDTGSADFPYVRRTIRSGCWPVGGGLGCGRGKKGERRCYHMIRACDDKAAPCICAAAAENISPGVRQCTPFYVHTLFRMKQ